MVEVDTGSRVQESHPDLPGRGGRALGQELVAAQLERSTDSSDLRDVPRAPVACQCVTRTRGHVQVVFNTSAYMHMRSHTCRACNRV